MHRLKTRKQFQATMAGGVIARSAHFALHRLVLDVLPSASLTEPDAIPSGVASSALFSVGGHEGGVIHGWLGAMAPKRWARRAVTRNAIKRQIYALGAEQGAALWAVHGTAAWVVRLRAGFDRKQYPSAWSEPLRLAVRTELVQLFARAAKRQSGRPA